MTDAEQNFDPALRAANIALSGRRKRETSRFASIELRFTDQKSGAWEVIAMTSVAAAAVMFVLGLWLL